MSRTSSFCRLFLPSTISQRLPGKLGSPLLLKVVEQSFRHEKSLFVSQSVLRSRLWWCHPVINNGPCAIPYHSISGNYKSHDLINGAYNKTIVASNNNNGLPFPTSNQHRHWFSTDSSTGKDKSPLKDDEKPPLSFEEELAQLSFLLRYKKLLKEYWYILLPVHGVTSIGWFALFYIIALTGVQIDVGYIGELFHLPEVIIEYLKNPKLGSLAVAVACYKLATPFRYALTVYAVVPTIKYLVRKGMIKPVPKLTSRKAIQKEVQALKNRVIKKRGE